jgi:phosphonate transport system substrate-binding protein
MMMKITTLKTNAYKEAGLTRLLLVGLCGLLLMGAVVKVRAAEYGLVVQPILTQDETRKAFQPLADYLSKATGQQIKLQTAVNFLTYWETMKKGKYDLVIDAAHFTDYRASRMNYTVLAKIPDVVSYSLVVHEDAVVLDPDELIGKTVATIGSPSLGAVRLEEMYPNPLRQPVIMETNNSTEAIERVINKKADAAIVPTPLVGRYPSLVTVTTTTQVPHIAISASNRVDQQTQQKISDALVNASKTAEGQAMLEAINFPGFEKANAKTYTGYASLLEGVWGY